MQVTHIPLAHTSLMHPLTQAYLSGDKNLERFYAWEPGFDGIAKALDERRNMQVDRKLLARLIEEQYANIHPDFATLPENRAVLENVRSLVSEDTFTITTGHQLNIFTGPLYSIYKIVSAITYARKLQEQFPGKRFVPVYWMASEDHDFEEINHIYLWGKKLTWQREPAGATGDIETLSLRNQVLQQLREMLAGRPHGDELLALFENAYSFPSLAQAHRALVHALFRDHGLVIIGANHVYFKQKLTEVLERDIFENAFYAPLQETAEALSRDFQLPVQPREINTFYLTPGRRSRIERAGDRYVAHSSEYNWTEEELRNEIRSNPERFSPNVVLRPVYQEILLPNLAYIGGTNEIAYWLQLRPVFEKAGVFYPQLVVRDSALWIGGKGAKLRSKGLAPDDLLLPLEELKAKYYDLQGGNHTAEKELDELLERYDSVRTSLQGLAPDLVAQVVKEINAHQASIKKWKSGIRKKMEEGEEVTVRGIEKLYALVYPDKSFQERHDNFIGLHMQYGPQWMNHLFENFSPELPALHIYSEE